jgi:hypothetical protein
MARAPPRESRVRGGSLRPGRVEAVWLRTCMRVRIGMVMRILTLMAGMSMSMSREPKPRSSC